MVFRLLFIVIISVVVCCGVKQTNHGAEAVEILISGEDAITTMNYADAIIERLKELGEKPTVDSAVGIFSITFSKTHLNAVLAVRRNSPTLKLEIHCHPTG